MAPNVADGDLITLRSVTPRAVRLGDLVFSQEPGSPPLLHRVISRRCGPGGAWVIRTKGDALNRPDVPVREEHVVGKVVAIHRELSSGACVELRLESRRTLNFIIAMASRFTPKMFGAFSRRLLSRHGATSFRERQAPVVA
jgi:signal peptidase I